MNSNPDPFRKLTLSATDAARLLRHMTEDPPNTAAQAALVRGRELLRQMQTGSVRQARTGQGEAKR